MEEEAELPSHNAPPGEDGRQWRHWNRPPQFATVRPKEAWPLRFRDADALLHQAALSLRVALQPIVSLWTGRCYGLEALLRGSEEVGFADVHDLLDAAEHLGALHRLEAVIADKALQAFVSLPFRDVTRLFLNIDNRTPRTADYDPERSRGLPGRWGVDPSKIILEISERHEISLDHLGGFVDDYRTQGFRLAVDDFGAGYAGLRLLYGCRADFIKIDRFFVSEIATDQHKKLFASRIVELAHTLGIRVIAEGVESVRELLACREIGCDFAQGFFIQRPTEEADCLSASYPHIADLCANDRRGGIGSRVEVTEAILRLEPIAIDTPLAQVLERFGATDSLGFIPVVNEMNEPQGLVREDDLKTLIYSPFGRDLIRNHAYRRALRDFLTPGRMVDIRSDVERILATYSFNDLPEGIIVTDDQKYVGFLTASHLLKLVNEQNLRAARDQNPLTGLPGNHAIDRHVRELLVEPGGSLVLVYFDFDNFKPFNDTYGFRQGDRVIMLFADLLKQLASETGAFSGHVGGDDFVLIVREQTTEAVRGRVAGLARKFRSDVVGFYDAKARQRGGIVAKGRDGRMTEFGLLTVSAGIVVVPDGRQRPEYEELIRLTAQSKKRAKRRADGVHVTSWSRPERGEGESTGPAVFTATNIPQN